MASSLYADPRRINDCALNRMREKALEGTGSVAEEMIEVLEHVKAMEAECIRLNGRLRNKQRELRLTNEWMGERDLIDSFTTYWREELQLADGGTDREADAQWMLGLAGRWS